ncbi:hypothetical protein HD806DRAFT_499433 [Xylariaceae sp. AK1471]|nr:hypothetical protein HD806DRAFT_499433 [Xylariaceae sp. AK1471]
MNQTFTTGSSLPRRCKSQPLVITYRYIAVLPIPILIMAPWYPRFLVSESFQVPPTYCFFPPPSAAVTVSFNYLLRGILGLIYSNSVASLRLFQALGSLGAASFLCKYLRGPTSVIPRSFGLTCVF